MSTFEQPLRVLFSYPKVNNEKRWVEFKVDAEIIQENGIVKAITKDDDYTFKIKTPCLAHKLKARVPEELVKFTTEIWTELSIGPAAPYLMRNGDTLTITFSASGVIWSIDNFSPANTFGNVPEYARKYNLFKDEEYEEYEDE